MPAIGLQLFGWVSAPPFVLDFTDTLDPRITASGAANGTRVNSAGLIEAKTTPRFDYNPATLAAKGLLIEGARTNLALRSAEFQTTWTLVAMLAFGSGSTVNAATAPDGTVSMDKIVPDTVSTTHQVRQDIATNVGATISFSAFLGSDGYNQTLLRAGNSTATSAFQVAVSDIDAGTIGAPSAFGAGATVAGASITEYANDVQRISLTGAVSGLAAYRCTAFTQVGGSPTFAGDGVSGLDYWGAQVEEGGFPSSYIPTTSAAVTRTADSLTMTDTNFANWWRPAGGTIVITADSAAVGTRIIWQADDGTANNRVTLWLNGTTAMATIVTGGATQADLSLGTVTANTAFNVALSYDTNDIKGCLNGGTVQTDASATLPVVDRCRFGADTTGNELFGHIREFTLYPAPSSAASLQTLTG